MSYELAPVLNISNAHPRDLNIKFYEVGHKYHILNDSGNKYTSVTTWLHGNFAKFDADLIIDNMMKGRNWKEGNKYWGKTKEEIKLLWTSNNGSHAGTEMHFRIECFMNNAKVDPNYTHQQLATYYDNHQETQKENINTTQIPNIEWSYFMNFIRDFPDFKPYRTEWIIFHEDIKLAGSIDMVYENSDGTVSIYDWKRSKEISKNNKWNKFAIVKEIDDIPDTNFWHYSLQLNAYKAILEQKYNKQVRDLFLVRLHPDADNYELIKVPDLSDEINKLFNIRYKVI
tara:strand:+ start:9 stop:863 length:855 start_codon:yes stop_codon:yes gene_type:complete